MSRLGLILPASGGGGGVTLPIAESDVTNLTTDLAAKIAKSIGTAKGDIIGFTASGTPVRRAMGPNGAALVSDSANTD
jgi:hypothetical protein